MVTLYDTRASGFAKLNAFDLELNYNANLSIQLDNTLSLQAFSIYHTASINLAYIGLYSGSIMVYDLVTLEKQTNDITQVCGGNYFSVMFIDQSSGYLLVSCENEGYIELWKTDGVTHTNTNLKLSVIGAKVIN